MHLVELFLPLADNEGSRFPQELFDQLRQELVDCFGGVTAYPRAPASGLWKVSRTERQHDDLVIYEVMTEKLDEEWWGRFRRQLEQTFRQDRILIRSHQIQVL